MLVEHRFDAKNDDQYETETLGFAEVMPWHAATERIVIKRKGVALAERRVSPHAPTVRVLSPNGGESIGAQANITWEASDSDGDPLSYTVFYNTGMDAIWWPIATGVTTTTISVDTSLLPGSAQGRVRVRMTDGMNTAEDDSDGAFVVPQKSPLVIIINPIAGRGIGPGEQSLLIGAAYDPEDGFLPGAGLTWTSDRDGLIGHGRQVEMKALSPGSHVITLTATDSQGQTATAQVKSLVRRIPAK